jgi:hypothetical protein
MDEHPVIAVQASRRRPYGRRVHQATSIRALDQPHSKRSEPVHLIIIQSRADDFRSFHVQLRTSQSNVGREALIHKIARFQNGKVEVDQKLCGHFCGSSLAGCGLNCLKPREQGIQITHTRPGLALFECRSRRHLKTKDLVVNPSYIRVRTFRVDV